LTMSEEDAALTEWERERNRHRVLLVWSGIVLVAVLSLIFRPGCVAHVQLF